MINGAHVIIQSTRPEADRAFFREVLELSHVDVGGGWLIFGLPPAEVAVHPSDTDSVHEFYLMCEDVNVLVKSLEGKGVDCGPIEDQGWGLLTSITLPGGGKLGMYEPRHARPASAAAAGASRRSALDQAKSNGRPSVKTAPKKRASKPVTPQSSKKAAPKKAAPKKAAPKKAASKKAAPKKAAPKKAAPKKAKKPALGGKRR